MLLLIVDWHFRVTHLNISFYYCYFPLSESKYLRFYFGDIYDYKIVATKNEKTPQAVFTKLFNFYPKLFPQS